jgi:hypothetical protein
LAGGASVAVADGPQLATTKEAAPRAPTLRKSRREIFLAIIFSSIFERVFSTGQISESQPGTLPVFDDWDNEWVGRVSFIPCGLLLLRAGYLQLQNRQ